MAIADVKEYTHLSAEEVEELGDLGEGKEFLEDGLGEEEADVCDCPGEGGSIEGV